MYLCANSADGHVLKKPQISSCISVEIWGSCYIESCKDFFYKEEISGNMIFVPDPVLQLNDYIMEYLEAV